MADDRTTIPARRGAACGGGLGPGKHVGSYRLVQVIAAGGFGTVYLAERGQDRFALKVLHDELVHSDEALARFEREISTVARISHPNVIRVIDFGKLEDERPYLVMELLQGRDLDRYLAENGRQTPDQALAILEPLCSALAAAHAAGVIHRDLKASNVFLEERDGHRRVVLVDFGIAKLLDPDSTDLTSSRHSVGTPSCMAPEQIMGGTVGVRTDIYALGSLLYQMLTGRPPFSDPSVTVMQHLHLHARRPNPSSLANVSLDVDEVVSRAMDRDPLRRYGGALEFLEALRAAIGRTRAAATAAFGLSVTVEVHLPKSALDDPDDQRLEQADDALVIMEDALRAAGLVGVVAGGSSATYVATERAAGRAEAARATLAAFGELCAQLEPCADLGATLVLVPGEPEQIGDGGGRLGLSGDDLDERWSILGAPAVLEALGIEGATGSGLVPLDLEQARRLAKR